MYTSECPIIPTSHNPISGQPVIEHMTTHSATEPGPTLVPLANNHNHVSVSAGDHISTSSSDNIYSIRFGTSHYPKDNDYANISNNVINLEGNEPSLGLCASDYFEDNAPLQISNKNNNPKGIKHEQYSSSNKEPSEKKELSSPSWSN